MAENAGPLSYVTGATGFVGSHLAELLLGQGARLRLMVRSASRLEPQLRESGQIVEGALSDSPEKLAEGLKDVDEVFHVAGLIGAIRQSDFDRVNVDGTRSIIEAIRLSGTRPRRLVVISSLAAHGPSLSVERPRLEADASDPRTMYGRSKFVGEKLAFELCHKYEIPLTVIRPPAVYGPRDKATFELFKLMARGLELRIGRERRHFDLIHVRDLVRGIVDAARAEASLGHAYYLTDEGKHELGEVLSVMREVMQPRRRIRLAVPVVVVKAIARMNDLVQRMTGKVRLPNSDKLAELLPLSWCCSGEKARRDFGFSTQVALREGLDETAQWYRAEKWI